MDNNSEQDQEQYQNQPEPRYHVQQWEKIAACVLILIVCVYLLSAQYFKIWPFTVAIVPLSTPTPVPTQTATPQASLESYRNEKYGFEIMLPETWKGYAVITSQWQGQSVSTGKIIDQGPIITLRHPQWTESNPREDMPIMVFTPEQWALVEQGEISLGAAPIPPSILGRNSKYILALPARYNYDFKTGWEEVDDLVHKLKAFEPETGVACIQVITPARNPQTGEIKDFPTPCDVPEGWVTIGN